jgi:hypothetical protein
MRMGTYGIRRTRKAMVLGVAGLTVAGVVMAGCTAGAKGAPPADGQRAATSQATPLSQAGQIAEGVQQALAGRLDAHEAHFGSGTNSPCSTSRASMFTSACQDAANAVNDDAAESLAEIAGKPGFATLRSVATELQKAVGLYTGLGCAHAPGDAEVRHQCLAPAAQIAQGETDLRGGVNMGLTGR